MVTSEASEHAPAMQPDQLPPPLDLTVIEELRALAGDGVDIVTELTGAFLDDGRERLGKMHDALAAGDELTARRAAHSLKGMSGAIGATHLSRLSNEFERAQPGTISRDRIAALEQEFQRVSAALAAAGS
jgi:HPt (histidine-containing phosphotransfer) domain-containing protein